MQPVCRPNPLILVKLTDRDGWGLSLEPFGLQD
jgi:hypothetical protein